MTRLFMRRDGLDDVACSWAPLRVDKETVSASITCPAGHHGTLTDHEIRDDGTVHPSVVCPHKDPPCSFHANIQLDGWKP